MTKLVKPNRNNSDQDVYHTTRECPYVTPDYKPPEDTSAPIEDYRECDWCAGEFEYVGRREKPCPYCENEIDTNLPDHLPCEESP